MPPAEEDFPHFSDAIRAAAVERGRGVADRTNDASIPGFSLLGTKCACSCTYGRHYILSEMCADCGCEIFRPAEGP